MFFRLGRTFVGSAFLILIGGVLATDGLELGPGSPTRQTDYLPCFDAMTLEADGSAGSCSFHGLGCPRQSAASLTLLGTRRH